MPEEPQAPRDAISVADARSGRAPFFSVVIPTYKRRDDLFACLACLSNYFSDERARIQNFGVEVIVSDDERSEALQRDLEQRFPWAAYKPGPQRGPAANRNRGARAARGDWLAFTDDDCLPQPGWLESYARRADGFDVLEGRTLPLGARARADEECPVNETGGYLWSCNFAIRKAAFEQLGGFDENFPAAAMEDVDFNVRVDQRALRRLFAPEAVVLHPWRREKGLAFKRAKARSSAYFLTKHPAYAAKYAPRAIAARLARSLATTIRDGLSRHRGRGLARSIALNVAHSWFLLRETRRRK